MNIQAILDTPIVGNAGSDQQLMNRIHNFLVGDNPIDQQIKALQKLDEVMGLGTADQITAKSIQEYQENHRLLRNHPE